MLVDEEVGADGDVGVACACNDVLLASMVGVLVICQLLAPSGTRA